MSFYNNNDSAWPYVLVALAALALGCLAGTSLR